MKNLVIIIFCGLLMTMISCNSQKETASASVYPKTKKVDTVDTYHGVQVSDPYRWLENDTSKETAEWVKSQNEVTSAYLKNITYRDKVLKRLEQVFNYERLTAPSKEGEFYYFYKNDGLQNHNVLYRKKGIDGTPEVFLDPNKFSADGTTKLSGISFTKDGSLAAYMVSAGGSDWNKAIVMKTLDKTIVEDTLDNIKFSGISWKRSMIVTA